MNRWISAALGLTMGAVTVQAQRPLSLGLAGGASFPTGNLGNGVNTGWHGLAVIGLNYPMQPLGLRLDVAYNQFAVSGSAPASGSGGRTSLSGTLNVTYRLPAAGSPFSPYVITGLGAYRLGCTGSASCGESTKFGWNAGLGGKFVALGLRAFIEGRYHSTSAAGGARYFPLTFGLMF